MFKNTRIESRPNNQSLLQGIIKARLKKKMTAKKINMVILALKDGLTGNM